MRTTQYSLILLVQIVLLCAALAVGAHVTRLEAAQVGSTNTAGVQQPPGGHGLEGLRQYLDH